MGRTTVELIIEVEERFGITIEDECAGEIRTVGDFYALVLRKLNLPQPTPAFPCPSSVAFYRTRRALLPGSGVPRSRIRPDTRLDDVLPHAGRRQAWEDLSAAVGVALPPLKHPHELEGALAIPACLVAAPLLVGGIYSLWLDHAAVAVACLVGLVVLPLMVYGEGLRRTTGWASRVPPSCPTVRALVEHAVRTQDDVWRGVCEAICHHSGWEAPQLAPQTPWEALRMD